MGRYVFINEDATRDAVLRASRTAAACGAKVVEVHSMAFLVDAGAETASCFPEFPQEHIIPTTKVKVTRFFI